jgi:hypothetical protein
MYMQVTAQIGTLSQMVLPVGITGAILGVIVGAWPRLTPSTSFNTHRQVQVR